jgi:hypothetical protein
LLAALARDPHDPPGGLSVEPATDDFLHDEDLQLCLYVCYELANRGWDGVDDRWE